MAGGLGRTLLIANPAAQNGHGGQAAERAEAYLKPKLGAELVVKHTCARGHAVDIAAHAAGFDAVLALGGDGVIHEVANGLMKLARDARPKLGVIPVGSGNDYARTLGMARSLEEDCRQLLEARPAAADVGNANGRWFVESISFGLDAAIALDTMERRVRTGRTGTLLYMESGFEQLFRHMRSFGYRAQFDDGPAVCGHSITFAVQIGPYYGGGFKVCPAARIDDGLFDLCISHPPLGPLRAAVLFLLAKSGRHTGFKAIEMRNARAMHIEFDDAPPAQIDGERIESRTFDITMQPAAINVLKPAGRR